MHEQKNLSIATATVSIKVIHVDGHKMTKATFRQIKPCIISEWPKNILGLVMDDGPYILWTKNGKMFRSLVKGWGRTNADGVWEPVTEYIEQLFIAT